MENLFLTLAKCTFIILVYYGFILDFVRSNLVAKLTHNVSLVSKKTRSYSVEDIENVTTLSLSVLMQFLLFLTLGVLLDFDFGILFSKELNPLLMLLGAILGLGEMALASFLGMVAMRITMAISPAAPTRNHYWYVLLNSGWMKLFSKAVEVLPRSISTVIVASYIAVEELIYRGVILVVLLPHGEILAVVLSTLIFAGYQAFNVPTWRAAMFPIIGALIMGVVHGVLFVTIEDIWPLVVAHVVFFVTVARAFK